LDIIGSFDSILLGFLINVNFYRSLRKFTYSLGQLIILEESLFFDLSHASLLFHFIELFRVPVVSKVAEPGSKNGIASVLEAEEHLLEDLLVKVVVAHQTRRCHEVKSVPEAVVSSVDEVIGAEVDLLELRINRFVVGFL